MAATRLTVDVLAQQPRWDARDVPGRSRGDLIGAWGKNVVARFGTDAVARVKRRVAALEQLPDTLTARDWLPVHTQLVLTEAIVDEFLDGDMRRLLPLIIADARASSGRVQLAMLRALGARRALRLAPSTFRKVHDNGNCVCDAARDYTRITFSGTPLFAHPTWRLLQLFATQSLLALADTPGTVVGESGSADGFVTLVEFGSTPR